MRPPRPDSTLFRRWLGLCVIAGLWLPVAEVVADESADREVVDGWLAPNLSEVVRVYRHLHRHPELSLAEFETAALAARTLASAGYAVTSEVGGTGVVGVFRNGDGPTLLIRGDMDALPVTEETGLDYASRVTTRREDGSVVGVMHACGHDVHTAVLLGTAQLLAAARESWSGTLVVVAQPAEELGQGALAMIGDGLFERFPRPDATLALHVEPELPAGAVGLVPGWAFANVDSVDISVHGRGGHGARPHTAVDPIVISAHMITALQTIVSRRVDPLEAGVVTVGSLHGGAKHNVIPDEVTLKLTVRSYSDATRATLLDGIVQIAEGTCLTFGCTRPPDVRIKQNATPAVYNDPALAARASELFAELLGADAVSTLQPSMGGEDFGRYARELGVPGLLYRLGTSAPSRWAESRREGGDPLPSLHSSRYAPDPEPSLRTGIRTLSHLSLAWLREPRP